MRYHDPSIATLLLLAACGGTSPPTADAPPDGPPAHLVVYISGNAPTIDVYDFAAGALTRTSQAAAFAANPSFLAATPTNLYAVSEDTSRVGAYAIDPATGALTFVDDAASGGSGPAHLSVDRSGAFVLAANYGDGQVAVLPVRADGGVAAPVATELAGANAHMIVTDAANRFALVPCKGADEIVEYAFDATTGALAPGAVTSLPAGAGPRHLAFAGAFAYVIDETDSMLHAYAYAGGALTELQAISNRDPAATGANTGAEVVATSRFVYASNRGDNTISTFAIGADGRLALVGHVATGATPRSFAVDPTGAWLLVANQDGDSVDTYAIDAATGLPSPVGAPVAFTAPSFVGFVALP